MKSTIAAALLLISATVDAQIYECQTANGQRLLTNAPCQGQEYIVLHPGVNPSTQRQAQRADEIQRQQRAQANAQAGQRFRQNAYADNPSTTRTRTASQKHPELCARARRGLHIQNRTSIPDQDRIRQLRQDESRYC